MNSLITGFPLSWEFCLLGKDRTASRVFKHDWYNNKYIAISQTLSVFSDSPSCFRFGLLGGKYSKIESISKDGVLVVKKTLRFPVFPAMKFLIAGCVAFCIPAHSYRSLQFQKKCKEKLRAWKSAVSDQSKALMEWEQIARELQDAEERLSRAVKEDKDAKDKLSRATKRDEDLNRAYATNEPYTIFAGLNKVTTEWEQAVEKLAKVSGEIENTDKEMDRISGEIDKISGEAHKIWVELSSTVNYRLRAAKTPGDEDTLPFFRTRVRWAHQEYQKARAEWKQAEVKNDPKAMQKAVENVNIVRSRLDEAKKDLLKKEAEVDALIEEYKHSKVPEAKIAELKSRESRLRDEADRLHEEIMKLYDKKDDLWGEQRRISHSVKALERDRNGYLWEVNRVINESAAKVSRLKENQKSLTAKASRAKENQKSLAAKASIAKEKVDRLALKVEETKQARDRAARLCPGY